MRVIPRQSEALRLSAKLHIALVLSAGFVLSAGCRSSKDAWQGNSAKDSAGPSPSTALKIRPLTDRAFQRTPERLVRGRYLVNGIGECFACHSPSNLNAPGWPPVRGKEGSGIDYGFWGFPGEVAPNLTPDRETGIGNWTDDMLARAIREGVAHDGHLLNQTIMPYEFYQSMSDEDLASIIVYLRFLPPIRNTLPPRTSKNTVPFCAVPIYAPIPQPDVSTPVKRGAYLVQLGACQWCHTPHDDDLRRLAGLEFAGGDLNTTPFSQASSANLTPDPSGISYYDEAQFLKTMHVGKVGARKISPLMPWWYFGQMNDDDLKAIFAYLRTLKPIHHRVDNTEPIAYCRICRRKHHGGALNQQMIVVKSP